MDALKGPGGQTSSKRVTGFVYLALCMLLFIYKEVLDKAITNPEIFIGMICTGGTLLGLGLFEYFAKPKDSKAESKV